MVGGRNSREHLAGHCKPLAVDEIRWRGADVRLDCCANGEECHGKSPKPFFWLAGAEGDQGLFQTSMKSFDHAVRFRMIRRGQNGVYPPYPCHLLEDGGGELASSVGCYRRGDAKVLNPTGHKGVDH